MRLPSFLSLFAGVTIALTALIAAEPSPAPSLDPDWIAESLRVQRLADAGDKAAALAAGQAFFEQTAQTLFTARASLAEASLRRINPFTAGDARRQAEAEIPTMRMSVTRALAHYAALVQTHPAFLTRLGADVPEGIKLEGRFYEGVFKTKTALTLAAVADLAIAKPDATRLAPAAFVSLLEQAASGDRATAFRRVADVLATKRGTLAPASKPASDLVRNASELVPSFFAATGDADTAEEVLSMALLIDPLVARAWAERAKARLALGQPGEALTDLLIAKVLEPDSPDVNAILTVYNTTPAYVANLYQEPLNQVDASTAAMSALFGGKLSPALERAATSARRNAGRAFFAASFNDGDDARTAAQWVREQHKSGFDVATPSARAAATAFDAQYQAAPSNRVGAILACFDGHASELAVNPLFWRMRINIFQQINRPELTESALHVAEALAPTADWIPATKDALAAAQRTAASAR